MSLVIFLSDVNVKDKHTCCLPFPDPVVGMIEIAELRFSVVTGAGGAGACMFCR